MINRIKYLSVLSIAIWTWVAIFLIESFAPAFPLIKDGKTIGPPVTNLLLLSFAIAVIYSFLGYGIRKGNKKAAIIALVIPVIYLFITIAFMQLLLLLIGTFSSIGGIVVIILILNGWKKYK